MPRINRIKRKKEEPPAPLAKWTDKRLQAEYKRLERLPNSWDRFFEMDKIFREQERRKYGERRHVQD